MSLIPEAVPDEQRLMNALEMIFKVFEIKCLRKFQVEAGKTF